MSETINTIDNEGDEHLSFRPKVFRPVDDWLIYQEQKPTEFTQGGIVVRDEAFTGQCIRMKVMDVGPACERVKVGDFILVGPGAQAAQVDFYNDTLKLMSERDVACVVQYCTQVEHSALESRRLLATPSELHS